MLRNIISFLRLVRWPNLLVIIATQVLVFYHVILPAYESAKLAAELTRWRFTQLVLVTLAISVSGFIINDLRDTRTDEINRPGTNPVPELGRDLVQWLYALCIMGGFLLSLIVAFRMNELEFLWLYPLAVGSLALYSWVLQGLPLVGNILIAVYCACVPGIIGLAEREGLRRLWRTDPELGLEVWRTFIIFMLFAFLATWLRELVKDLEDMKGDRLAGLRTFPVQYGEPASRKLGYLLAGAIGIALFIPIAFSWPSYQSIFIKSYLLVLLLALACLSWLLFRARTGSDWHRLSTGLKIYLLLGLGLLASFP